jgi:hypothetical protein
VSSSLLVNMCSNYYHTIHNTAPHLLHPCYTYSCQHAHNASLHPVLIHTVNSTICTNEWHEWQQIYGHSLHASAHVHCSESAQIRSARPTPSSSTFHAPCMSIFLIYTIYTPSLHTHNLLLYIIYIH